MAVGIQQGLLAEEVRVELPAVVLISLKGPGHPLYMTGPAVHVYDGFIHLMKQRGEELQETLTELDDRAVVDYLIKKS